MNNEAPRINFGQPVHGDDVHVVKLPNRLMAMGNDAGTEQRDPQRTLQEILKDHPESLVFEPRKGTRQLNEERKEQARQRQLMAHQIEAGMRQTGKTVTATKMLKSLFTRLQAMQAFNEYTLGRRVPIEAFFPKPLNMILFMLKSPKQYCHPVTGKVLITPVRAADRPFFLQMIQFYLGGLQK